MSLDRRLDKLELSCAAAERLPTGARLAMPWYEPHPAGGPLLASSERITWAEYERRFPDAPKPLRWHAPSPEDTDETP